MADNKEKGGQGGQQSGQQGGPTEKQGGQQSGQQGGQRGGQQGQAVKPAPDKDVQVTDTQGKNDAQGTGSTEE
jgi:hypothetical protein